MTGNTRLSRMSACQREGRSSVVKSCRTPGCSVVADTAILTETVSRVIRISGGRKHRLMTCVAGRRRIDVPRRMAGNAGQGSMGRRECKSGGAVIESATAPGGRIVALRTVVAVIVGHVTLGILVIGGVTGIAVGRRMVIAAGVAGSTLQ